MFKPGPTHADRKTPNTCQMSSSSKMCLFLSGALAILAICTSMMKQQATLDIERSRRSKRKRRSTEAGQEEEVEEEEEKT